MILDFKKAEERERERERAEEVEAWPSDLRVEWVQDSDLDDQRLADGGADRNGLLVGRRRHI